MDTENPYQSPKQMQVEKGETDVSREESGDEMRTALRVSIGIQVALILLGALMLDRGATLQEIAVVSLIYWMLALLILVRRNKEYGVHEVLFVKYGLLILPLVVAVVRQFLL